MVQCACCKTMKKKLRKCTGCLVIYYCSKQCQRTHRKHHKETCSIESVIDVTDSSRVITQSELANRGFLDSITRYPGMDRTARLHVNSLERDQNMIRNRHGIIIDETKFKMHVLQYDRRDDSYLLQSKKCSTFTGARDRQSKLWARCRNTLDIGSTVRGSVIGLRDYPDRLPTFVPSQKKNLEEKQKGLTSEECHATKAKRKKDIEAE